MNMNSLLTHFDGFAHFAPIDLLATSLIAIPLAEAKEPTLDAIIITTIIITILIIVNGIFVASEFALAGSQHTRIAQIVESGSSSARQVLKILRSPKLINRYLSTAQIGITVATLGLGMYGEATIASWLNWWFGHTPWLAPLGDFSGTISVLLAIFVITYLHVVVGEMVPKSLALQSPNESAVRLNGVMTFFQRLFLPLSVVLNGIGDAILRMVGVPPMDAASRLVSSEELEFIVAESSEGGLLAPSEQLFMENILDFQERHVGQVMTPRTRLVGVPLDATLDEVLTTVGESRFSRYPVYAEDMDHVQGILHIKDISRFHVNESISNDKFSVEELMRNVTFVPESVSLAQMLGQFQRGRSQLAMIVDEYGGVAGMVTMEDLVEELVGEIQDEHEEEILPFERLSDGQVLVRGDLLLDELEQHFELELDDDAADTIGGFVMALLGRVPQPGDTVQYEDSVFEVQSVDGFAVEKVLISLPKS